jgi:hypothetical protein
MPDSVVKLSGPKAEPLPVAGVPATITVQEALSAIRQDSCRDPEIYLDDTAVPYGGE